MAISTKIAIENLQEATRQVLQARVPDHNVRIELIPIEWHRHIHDQVDPIMNRITLKSIPTIRLIENDYLADVLYYFSKDRGQKIIDNVAQLLNTSYHNFLEKHPDFNGEVVMLGYSLGGVIIYDILSHQRQPTEEELPAYQKLDFQVPHLDFKPTYFFTLGSPLGAVLTFRNQSPIQYHPDHDIIFENLFHPFDPLAYRFEPLINEYYTDQPAVLIDRSIPLGPSFSFPSMPSFPGLNLFSFFSWKMTPQQSSAEEPLQDATAAAAAAVGEEANAARQENENLRERNMDSISMTDKNNSLMSSVNTFLQYFTRGRGSRDDDKQDDQGQGPQREIGIITWDPLREQTREQLLAFRDEMEKKDLSKNSAHSNNEERPQLRTRAKTDNARDIEADDEHMFSLPPGSLFEGSLDDTHLVRPSTPQKKMSRHHHLVEVLGIDGVRMDSIERAQLNFGHRKQEAKRKLTTSSSNDDPSTIAEETALKEEKRKAEDKASVAEPRSSKERNDNKGNLGAQLNEELSEPGPGITEPGETKADVAQDISLPKGSNRSEREEDAGETGTSQEEAKTEEDEEKERQRELNKLPGGRRIDYVLQPESFMSMIANEYLVGLRAHFSYWTNKDLLWHIVRRLENLDFESENQPENNSKPTEEVPTASDAIPEEEDEIAVSRKEKQVKTAPSVAATKQSSQQKERC
ncbi:hypothetical protein EC973_000255 [Apophysomyces ossiformis]|uniref:DDHD domain-containing protein n=1 Tax=Apophysomyces ossiformis TaxID=679940 RepID=A0A8H7C0E4_9FUNG|nr:hypothetical protein EC973_000255 [Apophysomyces ossiformis]